MRTVRRGMAALLVVGMASALFGCSDFRQRANDVHAQLEEALHKADVAEAAVAQNTASLQDLQARVAELGTRLHTLETALRRLEASLDESDVDIPIDG